MMPRTVSPPLPDADPVHFRRGPAAGRRRPPETLVPVTSADGTRIGCWRYGEGTPLVLVHGSSDDHSRWSRVGTLLARTFTVYAVDRRGRGASGDSVEYSLEAEARDIEAVLAVLGRPAYLLGHSYGAICCLEAAARGANVSRLVLYEPPLPVSDVPWGADTPQGLQELLDSGDREGVVLRFFRDMARMEESQLDTMRAVPSFAARLAIAHTLPRELAFSRQCRTDGARLRAIRCPTLLLRGSGRFPRAGDGDAAPVAPWGERRGSRGAGPPRDGHGAAPVRPRCGRLPDPRPATAGVSR
jgi:pimeloyl-ACP methyl ester carboxylesterase